MLVRDTVHVSQICEDTNRASKRCLGLPCVCHLPGQALKNMHHSCRGLLIRRLHRGIQGKRRMESTPVGSPDHRMVRSEFVRGLGRYQVDIARTNT